MSLTREDLYEGAKLECVSSKPIVGMYTVGRVYTVLKEANGDLDEEGEEAILIEDNTGESHAWSVESLCGMVHEGMDYAHWHTRFKLHKGS